LAFHIFHQIEAEEIGNPVELFISSVGRARSTYDQSVVFVRVRNPLVNLSGVTVRISIRKDGLRIVCDARCNPEVLQNELGGEGIGGRAESINEDTVNGAFPYCSG
jgi:hypothetical protein